MVAATARGLDEVLPPGYPLCAPIDDVEALGKQVARMIDEREAIATQIASLHPEIAARFSPEVMASRYADAYQTAATHA